MRFICQIALDPALFGDIPTRMAYLFVADWDYESVFPDIFEPDGGENALIIQPGGTWSGPSLPLREGPSLYRRSNPTHQPGQWEQTSCEFAVEGHYGEDHDAGAWDTYPRDPDASNAYWTALQEDKIGGTPTPTPFGPRFSSTSSEWRLLLQINAKDNAAGNGDPFYLNLAYDGVGYAFISPDGRAGKFLASR
jgi:hypothetical protein